MAANGTAEIQPVQQTNETDSVKGKEIDARKGTTPPLNFLAILRDAKIRIDMSCPDKLCNQLYAGFYLMPNKLKYLVDEKTNKNCFMLFARQLDICWSDNSSYWEWKWTKEETSGKEIEVAELLEVCWLDVRGKFDRTIDLSPGTVYEIVFEMMIKEKISAYPMTLTMILPHSRTQRSESLVGKPLQEWFKIVVGEFIMSPENVGNIEFSMEEHGTDWKRGLIVKCAIIRPKK